MIKKAQWFFYWLLLTSVAQLHAQGKAMLIEQIEGKSITREGFDKKGKLTGKQVFTAGKMTRSDGFFL